MESLHNVETKGDLSNLTNLTDLTEGLVFG